ncbi:putative RNA polymerase II subunit B1 CTD phosphatase RPAP2 [Neolecta irregularis DAH-3]|uniref:RNA polymerase II subunit B1 CTD phosphatase RPAP2 homolog n=1 Tax=Neolecta irregularis (strain DAH-3) TaxID=1198029 RepID=A0A1U7LMN1_NEOID|nr:putative RNA polymerase II subunit B1 CTD phosphatase RPAP2 [Neolecta irregularis DAH-3]|eukprot:OLL23802.1 putative RNA polymerase II subunit B1 CTD phosphatase RPAP2 [Neolecta irregularis DAH-3]
MAKAPLSTARKTHIRKIFNSKFRISMSQKKILDLAVLRRFCSKECYGKSMYYAAQLSEEPIWLRDLDVPDGESKYERDIVLFEEGDMQDVQAGIEGGCGENEVQEPPDGMKMKSNEVDGFAASFRAMTAKDCYDASLG